MHHSESPQNEGMAEVMELLCIVWQHKYFNQNESWWKAVGNEIAVLHIAKDRLWYFVIIFLGSVITAEEKPHLRSKVLDLIRDDNSQVRFGRNSRPSYSY